MKSLLLNTMVVLCFVCGSLAVAAENGAPMGGMDHGAMVGSDSVEPLDMRWDSQNDAAFLSGMIAHHQGAIDMTRAIAGKTKDLDVRRWAGDIVRVQEDEIRAMRDMLADLGLQDEDAAKVMRRHMEEMMANPVSHDPEVNYVALMIPHHAGAIDMSVPALIMSDNKEIRALAENIIVSQAKEIAEFRKWLDKRDTL